MKKIGLGVTLATSIAFLRYNPENPFYVKVPEGKTYGIIISGIVEVERGATFNGLILSLMTKNKGKVNGVLISGINKYGDEYGNEYGNESITNGVGVALENISNDGADYSFNGIQVGLGNKADKLNGIQIGVFGNDAYKLNGIQIGAGINLAYKGKTFQIGFINSNGDGCAALLFCP